MSSEKAVGELVGEKAEPREPRDEVAELRARLQKARSAAAAVEEAERARRELEQLKADVEAAEAAAREDAALAEAERKFQDLVDRKTLMGRKIAAFRSAGGLVIIKAADPIKFKQFQDKEGTTKLEDLEALIAPCRVYPEPAEFDRICDKWPATINAVADRVAYLAGARRSELSGK